jgi:hypothetical protein
MTKTEARPGMIVRDGQYRPWVIVGFDPQPRQTYLKLKALIGDERRRGVAATLFACPGACPDCGRAVEEFENEVWCGGCGWNSEYKRGQVLTQVVK